MDSQPARVGQTRDSQTLRWLPLVLLLPLAWVYWTYLTAPATSVLHDDGLYSVTARSLAEGRGYVIESLPEPIPQTKYPVLFPALLAPVHWWGGSDAARETASRLVALAGALLAAWLSWLSARRLGLQPGFAIWVPVIWLAAPAILFQATSVLPDTMFAASILGALLLLDSAEKRAGGAWALAIGAGALAGAAFLMRSAGLAVLICGLALALRKKWLAFTLFTLTAAALIAPWLVWQTAQPEVSDPVLQYYTRQSYRETNLLAAPNLQAGARMVLQNLMPHSNGPLYLNGISSALTWPLSIVIWLAAGWCALRLVLAGSAAFGAFWLLYTGVILAWAWPQARYLAPLLPLNWIFAGKLLQGWKRSRRTDRALLALAAAGIAWNAWSLMELTLETRREGWPASHSDNWAQTRAALDWIRDHTPPDAVVGANLDPQVYQHTGRKSIRLFKTDPFRLYYGRPEPDEAIGGVSRMRQHLLAHRVSHILLTPMNGFRERDGLHECLRKMAARYPGSLELAWSPASRRFWILRVHRERLQPAATLKP